VVLSLLRVCESIPIWWSQMRVHSEAMSPSSSTFFACIFRLLGAVGGFCACMSAVCVFPSAPLALCVVAMVAGCNMPQCGERESDGATLSRYPLSRGGPIEEPMAEE